MNCPECGSHDLTVLESRQNKINGKSPHWDNPDLEAAIKKAVDTLTNFFDGLFKKPRNPKIDKIGVDLSKQCQIYL